MQVGGGNRGFEVGDGWCGWLLFVGVFLFVGLIVDLGEELGSDAGTASKGADLCVIDGGSEGIPSGRRRCGSQRIVLGIDTGFPREVDSDGRAGGGVFGVIGPGIGGAFMGDIGRFKRDWRVARAVRRRPACLGAAAAAPGGGGTKYGGGWIVGRLES